MLAQVQAHHHVDVQRHSPAKLVNLKHRWQQKPVAKFTVIKPTKIELEKAQAPSFVGLAG